jgi:hypothetical protein
VKLMVPLLPDRRSVPRPEPGHLVQASSVRA